MTDLKPHFTDTHDRRWDLTLTVGDVKRIRKLLKVDLLDAEGGQLFFRLSADPILLVDVIWLIVEEQADHYGVTDEEFGRSFDGDVIDVATEAFLTAYVNFSRQFRRPGLQKALDKVQQIQQTMVEEAETILDDPDEMEELRKQIRGVLSTRPPEHLESGTSTN